VQLADFAANYRANFRLRGRCQRRVRAETNEGGIDVAPTRPGPGFALNAPSSTKNGTMARTRMLAIVVNVAISASRRRHTSLRGFLLIEAPPKKNPRLRFWRAARVGGKGCPAERPTGLGKLRRDSFRVARASTCSKRACQTGGRCGRLRCNRRSMALSRRGCEAQALALMETSLRCQPPPMRGQIRLPRYGIFRWRAPCSACPWRPAGGWHVPNGPAGGLRLML